MVTLGPDAQGVRLRSAELMALRDTPGRDDTRKPATRRPGAVPGRPPGTGLDLREIRAFSDGDDARRIDPNATARTGALHVRTFHEDSDDVLLLIADFRGGMLWGTGRNLRSVRAARTLARRGWLATARGASVAAIAVTSSGTAVLGARPGMLQMTGVARMLAAEHDAALRNASKDRPLSESLFQAGRIAPPGAEVLIATGPDGIGPTDLPALAQLARRRRVRVLLPLDPVEIAPPEVSLPIRTDAAIRFARLKPLDTSVLRETLHRLKVGLELVHHDAE